MMVPVYNDLIDEVFAHGSLTPSRHGETTEVIGKQVRFSAGTMVERRGMNHALGWMELLQLLAGVWQKSDIVRVAKRARVELFTEQMAYGPRAINQVEPIIEALIADPPTRQAVLFIAKPDDGPTSNLPCTISIQFLRRSGLLHAVVSMRSWDLVRGITYDMVMFGGLTMAVARCVGVKPGTVVVNAGSAHIYDKDVDKAVSTGTRQFHYNLAVPDTWPRIREWALRGIATLQPGGVPVGLGVSEVLEHPRSAQVA